MCNCFNMCQKSTHLFYETVYVPVCFEVFTLYYNFYGKKRKHVCIKFCANLVKVETMTKIQKVFGEQSLSCP